ncbi:TIGR04222 domain-containing membrane protein [Streptomyces sp. NPDC058527]
MVWIPLLLVACAVTAVACARLCRAAITAGGHGGGAAGDAELTLDEAAFLAGGPGRVTELTLVSMHRARRLLLAHTGWATVVDGSGHGDELERAVLGAIGPGGQAPVPRLRPMVAAAACVRRIEEGLVERGLAVPAPGRREVAAGTRAVRGAFLLALALGAVSVPLAPDAERARVVAGFVLPLTASGLCLLLGRAADSYPRSPWASHAGQRLLAGLSAEDPLTALATRGPVVLEPELRAALGRPPERTEGTG